MTVLDAYALVAMLSDDPPRSEVEPLLRQADNPGRIASLNLAEAIDVLVRVKLRPPSDVSRAIELLVGTRRLGVVPLDDGMARRAGGLRAQHYNNRRQLSIADCVAAVTAETLDDALATADPSLASAARELGVEVVALPDSKGRRP